MPETAQAPQMPARKSPLVVRIALYVTLTLVIICAVLWFSLKRDLDRGIALYDAGKYQQAAALLQPLMNKPLARLRVRQAAQVTLGLCKAKIATQVAMKERSAEGYREALHMLAEAKELAGPRPEIEEAIKECTEHLQKLGEPSTRPVLRPGPPPESSAPPPRMPPAMPPREPAASPPS